MSRVNGKPVAPHGSWLDTCRAAGVDVPAMCADDALAPGGHCRACLIEVDGRLVPACSTPARAGAIAVTDSAALREYRRDLGELMLSEARPRALAAKRIVEWGADGTRYARREGPATSDHTHHYLRFDAERCILCRRCVRTCAAVGRFVFAIEGRGAASRLAFGGAPLSASACDACGACIPECPAEAITLAVAPAGR